MRPEIRFTPPRRARRRIAYRLCLRIYQPSKEESTNGFSDTLDVVTKNLPVALGTALSETLRK